jgi:DNA-binding XRE family transcriptional regulator
MKYEMHYVKDTDDAVPLIRGIVLRKRGRAVSLPDTSFCDMSRKEIKRPSRVRLAANLRAARSLYRWSQEEMGLQCGLKRTYVGALERREVNPGIDNLDKLAIGIGVLTHVLLLSPEVAYSDIYAAFKLTPASAR